jgi:FAD-dependent urate hydroxylase
MPAGDGLVQWWFDTRLPMADLRERFRDYRGPVADLLARITDVQIFPHVLHRVPDRWGTGPVTLLGDAAHAFPPSQAQGANQALEDAWALTRHLRNGGKDLRGYERERARRVRRLSRLAARETTNRPPGPAARLAGRLLSPTAAGHAYLALIRRFSTVLTTR